MPPAKVFGQPLRSPSWASLPLRQRLALELLEFLDVHPPARRSLLIFWHSARTVALATLARADCEGGTNVCLHARRLDDMLSSLQSLVLCSSLIVVRSNDMLGDGHAMDMVPIPPDFATFDEDPETAVIPPPPIVGRIAGTYNLTSTTLNTPRGPAFVAVGHVTASHAWVDWLERDGLELFRSGRIVSGTFMPPPIVEATLMQHGLFFHGTTNLLPVFVGDIPWELRGKLVSVEISISYVPGCTASTIAAISEWHFSELDDRSQYLRTLLDRAAALVAATENAEDQRRVWEREKMEWETQQRAWSDDLLRRLVAFGAVPSGTRLATHRLRIHACTEAPGPGAWTADNERLAEDVERFAADGESLPLRQGPFLVGSLG